MDEPFSNLDASLRAKVRTDVRHILKAAGTAAIFVTHDQDEALSLADEVGIMLDGCVVQVGAPSNVYAHPESLAVASFLGDANILPGEATNGRVTTELGILNTTKPSSGHVSVLVRPEEVNLGHVVDDQERYQVIEKDFYGHDQMLQLRMPSGRVLRVRCGPGHLANPGDWVSASVSTPVTTFADHR
jgi:iron(III) transport system ATP-binding protein